MTSKVFLVRLRQRDANAREWIETHIVATVDERAAAEDVLAKVRRQGFFPAGPAMVSVLSGDAPAEGVRTPYVTAVGPSWRQGVSHELSNLTWNEQQHRLQFATREENLRPARAALLMLETGVPAREVRAYLRQELRHEPRKFTTRRLV